MDPVESNTNANDADPTVPSGNRRQFFLPSAPGRPLPPPLVDATIADGAPADNVVSNNPFAWITDFFLFESFRFRFSRFSPPLRAFFPLTSLRAHLGALDVKAPSSLRDVVLSLPCLGDSASRVDFCSDWLGLPGCL